MYLHIVPKLINKIENKCRLVSVEIPELEFKIEDDALSVGRPFPNKTIWIGMRKGRKATNGLLIKTEKVLKRFTTEYKWDIEHMGVIVHRVTNYIELDEFDMVSQDISFNGGFDKWESRQHSAYENMSPVHIQPFMETYLPNPDSRDAEDMWTEYDWGCFLNLREESLLLNTIESQRLGTEFSLFSKLPSLEQAFYI